MVQYVTELLLSKPATALISSTCTAVWVLTLSELLLESHSSYSTGCFYLITAFHRLSATFGNKLIV